jgi:hypothetical protein
MPGRSFVHDLVWNEEVAHASEPRGATGLLEPDRRLFLGSRYGHCWHVVRSTMHSHKQSLDTERH